MSDRQKTPSYGRALLQLGAMAGGFVIAISLGHHAFVESLKPPPAPPAPAAAPPSAVSGGGFTLTSTSIALPDDDPPYPAGPGADLMNGNCTACHSASMALTQPRLSAEQWTAIVKKMRDIYKAPVVETDVPAIVAYLTAMSGKLEPESVHGAAGQTPSQVAGKDVTG